MAVVVDTHTLTQVSQDIVNNTSVVRYLVKLKTTEGSYNINNITTTYKIDGTTYTSVHKLPQKTTTTIIDKSVTVNHNADGTKTVNAEFSCPTNISAGTIVRSISTTLSTIPRASSIVCNDANIGSGTTITINKASDSFTTTLSYKASGQNSWTTIVTKTSQSSYGWTVPTSFYALIPNSPTITCEIKAETFSGNTSVGTKTTTATFTATGNPTLSTRTATDINSTTANLTSGSSTSTTKMVKYASNIKVQITAVAQNSAYISSVKVNGSSVSLDGSSTSTTRSGNITFNSAETNTFSIVVTDSRGNSTTQNTSNTLTMVNYVPLTINQSIKRNQPTDEKVNINLSGNYFNSSFGNTSNTLTVQYRYKESSASSWGSWTTVSNSKSGNTYTASTQLSSMDYTKSYNFEVRATDEIGTKTITGITVAQGQPVFWWNETGLNVTNRIRFYDSTLQDYRSVNGYDISYMQRTAFSISANSSKTLTFTQNSIAFILTGKGSLGGANHCSLIFTYGQGTTDRTKIQTLYAGSGHISFSINGQTITVSNSSSSGYSFTMLFLIGSANNVTVS